jgi:hypothetical protein
VRLGLLFDLIGLAFIQPIFFGHKKAAKQQAAFSPNNN